MGNIRKSCGKPSLSNRLDKDHSRMMRELLARLKSDNGNLLDNVMEEILKIDTTYAKRRNYDCCASLAFRRTSIDC